MLLSTLQCAVIVSTIRGEREEYTNHMNQSAMSHVTAAPPCQNRSVIIESVKNHVGRAGDAGAYARYMKEEASA